MPPCPPQSTSLTCHLYASQHAHLFQSQDNDLPSFGAEDFSVTLSGFGTGATQALVTTVANSATISGVGLIGGVSYGDNNAIPNKNFLNQSFAIAAQEEALGEIDPLFNLYRHSVYLQSGIHNFKYQGIKQQNQRDFLYKWGTVVNVQVLKYDHVIPISNTTYCIPAGQPQLQNCGYDTAGQMLKWLYQNLAQGSITNWNPMDLDWDKKGVLREFNQVEFFDSMIHQFNGLDQIGYIYYPFSCIDGKVTCKIHFFFHACGQQVNSLENSGLDSITQLGFLEYAAANNLIVVFPQAKYNMILNPNTCWDISGQKYMDYRPNYLSKDGFQNKFVMNVIQRLTSPIDKTKYRYYSSNLLTGNQYQTWFTSTQKFLRTLPDLILWTYMGVGSISLSQTPTYYHEIGNLIKSWFGY